MKHINASVFSVLLLTASVNFATIGEATAEEKHFGTRTPTVTEFVDGLRPQLRFRGIRPASATVESSSVSMQLTFAFDSFELTDKSKASLDNLSTALKTSDLATYTFKIEGHTDAVGSESYNMSLSRKRARSVMNYLVDQHGVDMNRLRVIGKGEDDLYDPNNPSSEVNRRVAIINVGD